MGHGPRRAQTSRACKALSGAVQRSVEVAHVRASGAVTELLERRQMLSATPSVARASASKLDTSLNSLYQNYLQTGSAVATPSLIDASDGTNSTGSLLQIDNGSVELQSFARVGQHNNLIAALKRLKATSITGNGREVDAMVPISNLGKLAKASSLRFAQAGLQVVNSGSVTSQGDNADQAANARAAFGITGAGVKVGIISDSFNTSAAQTDKFATDVASGDLPSNVQVLADGLSTDTDEGRAMAQVIYDSAPALTCLRNRRQHAGHIRQQHPLTCLGGGKGHRRRCNQHL